MNKTWTLTLSALLTLLLCVELSAIPSYADFDDLDDSVLSERLQNMHGPVRYTYNAEIRAAIRRYVTSGYLETQAVLGRAEMYFPTFEHYLRLNDLPDQLKYLTIVESGIRPDVKSYAGAAGLWQFMPRTAAQYDIVVNNYVDERRDPIRSTVAAMIHLKKQYDRYHNWELALAAYNCGAGNVNKAIRRAGGVRDFWKIRHFLPKETQQYVPRFIAASYVAEYFYHHDLRPAYPEMDLQYTRTVLVNSYLALGEVARITGSSLKVLQKLNPHLKRNAIPYSTRGTYLTIPETGFYAFQDHILDPSKRVIRCDLRRTLLRERNGSEHPGSYRSIYFVRSGDRLDRLASVLGMNVEKIVLWNNLSETPLYPGQALALYISDVPAVVGP